MNILLIYMVKVGIYLIAFYLVYSLLLSRDTTYGRNRAYILLSLGFAIIFPLISFQTGKPLNIQQFGRLLEEVFVSANKSGADGSVSWLTSAHTLQLIYTIYIIGVLILLFKLLVDFINLLFLINRQRNGGSRIIRFHGFNTAGFSAMGYIFINTRLSSEEAGEIIRHEQNHLHRNHFIDIIFIEIVKAFQWFNPVVYLVDRSLRAIHEFQADQGCLSSGIPVVSYQSLLLSQVFKSKAFNLTNSFSNPSLIKRRMIMMTKKRTPSFAAIKLLLVVPVTIIVFLAISAYKYADSAPPPPPPPPPVDNQTAIDEEASGEVPFVVVEEMPMFPGGDKELLKYIGQNTIYPEIAKENNIQGRVIIRFCVTAKGGVSQISVLKGVSPDLDAEAIRVVETLPSFKPGRQGGKAVPVWYMVPITFALR
jgi:TonB family protein